MKIGKELLTGYATSELTLMLLHITGQSKDPFGQNGVKQTFPTNLAIMLFKTKASIYNI